MAIPMWQGQVALVSGAGSESGIGLAIARRFGREGVRFLITASRALGPKCVAQMPAQGIGPRGM